jgi:hypothetical protein
MDQATYLVGLGPGFKPPRLARFDVNCLRGKKVIDITEGVMHHYLHLTEVLIMETITVRLISRPVVKYP